MSPDKLYSVSFVLVRLYKQFEKQDLNFVFSNSTGIFTAKPLYVDDGALGYLTCSIESYDVVSFENIRNTEIQASEFDRAFREAHSSSNKFSALRKLVNYPEMFFRYIEKFYEESKLELDNSSIPRTLYEVNYLDKELSLDFVFLDEATKLISIQKITN